MGVHQTFGQSSNLNIKYLFTAFSHISCFRYKGVSIDSTIQLKRMRGDAISFKTMRFNTTLRHDKRSVFTTFCTKTFYIYTTYNQLSI